MGIYFSLLPVICFKYSEAGKAQTATVCNATSISTTRHQGRQPYFAQVTNTLRGCSTKCALGCHVHQKHKSKCTICRWPVGSMPKGQWRHVACNIRPETEQHVLIKLALPTMKQPFIYLCVCLNVHVCVCRCVGRWGLSLIRPIVEVAVECSGLLNHFLFFLVSEESAL